METNKEKVHEFWNNASCGEKLFLNSLEHDGYKEHAATRYELEPYILKFANFSNSRGKRVLEIGVGLGADHQLFAENGAQLYGIDLTERAIEHTKRRFSMLGLSSELNTGDAENLIFENEAFDIVYSWGVLHHSPNTAKAIAEVYRVLKPGGEARIMIYHKWSLVGFMLWCRFGLLRLKPWLSLTSIYDKYLESPGTKAYSIAEAKQLFSSFSKVDIKIQLSHGDLLLSGVGQRHKGLILALVKVLWPRGLLEKYCSKLGLCLLVIAEKE